MVSYVVFSLLRRRGSIALRLSRISCGAIQCVYFLLIAVSSTEGAEAMCIEARGDPAGSAHCSTVRHTTGCVARLSASKCNLMEGSGWPASYGWMYQPCILPQLGQVGLFPQRSWLSIKDVLSVNGWTRAYRSETRNILAVTVRLQNVSLPGHHLESD